MSIDVGAAGGPVFENKVKRLLGEQRAVWGAPLGEPSAMVARASVAAGLDFLWIETEHRPYGTEAIVGIPVVCRRMGCVPIVRVAGLDPQLIKKALDTGASGVMVPQVNTADEARLAVRFAKYPPEGTRGVSPYWTLDLEVSWQDYLPQANDETLVIVQIESVEGLANLEPIAEVPGVDIVFAGPMDLSAALGHIGEVRHPRVQEVLVDFARRVHAVGKTCGTTASGVQGAHEAYERGYRFISLSHLLEYGRAGLSADISQLRKEIDADAD